MEDVHYKSKTLHYDGLYKLDEYRHYDTVFCGLSEIRLPHNRVIGFFEHPVLIPLWG